jgi:sulfide:quinone oxidoreductase
MTRSNGVSRRQRPHDGPFDGGNPMQTAQLTPDLSVAPQLSEPDLQELAARGVRSVINNRPDGEGLGQPASAELAAAARRLGMEYRYIPVISGQLSEDQVDAFKAALAELPKPAVAFCRSGTRSSMLWALASAPDLDGDTILNTARAAGYDLHALRGLIESYAARRGGS